MPSHGRGFPDNRSMPASLVLTWEALDDLVGRLARSCGRDFDLVLAITRGGLVPAGMLAYRLDLREILVAGAVFIEDPRALIRRAFQRGVK